MIRARPERALPSLIHRAAPPPYAYARLAFPDRGGRTQLRTFDHQSVRICGVHMNRVLGLLAISVLSGCLSAQVSPTTPKAARVRIIRGPKIELAKEHLAIINWTTNNPNRRFFAYALMTLSRRRPTTTQLVRCRPPVRAMGRTAQSTTSLPPRGNHDFQLFMTGNPPTLNERAVWRLCGQLPEGGTAQISV